MWCLSYLSSELGRSSSVFFVFCFIGLLWLMLFSSAVDVLSLLDVKIQSFKGSVACISVLLRWVWSLGHKFVGLVAEHLRVSSRSCAVSGWGGS
ncbi:hypothetical protein U1Q18_005620 [Sarracenia purpurea var. burkii]